MVFGVVEWSFPTGGAWYLPMFFHDLSSPFMGLGRGVAFDIALWIQLWLCCIGGYLWAKRLGMVGGGLLIFPFVLGQYTLVKRRQ